MNRITYTLCVSLALTSLSFFSIGLAEFTLFHATVLIYCLRIVIYNFLLKKTIRKTVPRSSIAFIILLAYISCVNIFFINDIKATSYLYTLIVVLELFLLSNIVRKLELKDIRKIIKAIILLYFISITVGSLLISLGTKHAGIFDQFIQIYDVHKQARPGGFSSEPSYAAIILVFSLYALLKSNNFLINRKEILWYCFSIVAILLTQSSYGYMLLGILLVYFLFKSHSPFLAAKFLRKHKELGFLMIVVAVSALAFVIINADDNKSIQRLVDICLILSASGWNIVDGIYNISYTDSSAGMRLLPTVQLIDYFSNTDFIYVIFGRGAGQSTLFFSELYMGQLTLLGFIPAFVYNYGIAGLIIALLCFSSLFPKRKLLFSILFFLFLFNADFNTQIFIYVLFIAMLSRQIEKVNAVFKVDQLKKHE